MSFSILYIIVSHPRTNQQTSRSRHQQRDIGIGIDISIILILDKPFVELLHHVVFEPPWWLVPGAPCHSLACLAPHAREP